MGARQRLRSRGLPYRAAPQRSPKDRSRTAANQRVRARRYLTFLVPLRIISRSPEPCPNTPILSSRRVSPPCSNDVSSNKGLAVGPAVVPVTFEEFYRDEYPVTLAVVLALRGSRVGAEEVVQEAFLRAHARWDDVRSLAEPAHWVRRVALNLATSRWRRLGSEARALARLPADRSAAEDRGYQRVEDADRFWRAVRRLAPQ